MDVAMDFLGCFGAEVELPEATSLQETTMTTQQPQQQHEERQQQQHEERQQQQHEEQQETKEDQLTIKVCNNKTHFGITSSQIDFFIGGRGICASVFCKSKINE